MSLFTKIKRCMLAGTGLFLGLFVPLAVVGLFAYLITNAIDALTMETLSSLMSTSWLPAEQEYGTLPLILGTLVSSFAAIPLVIGIGLPCAYLLAVFDSNKFTRMLSIIVATLCGLPSVVVGIFALGILGINFLSSIFVLFILLVPHFVISSTAILSQLSGSFLDTARSLGLSDYAIFRLIVTTKFEHIIGAALIVLGRGFGEAVALTFVAGNIPTMAIDLFGPFRTITTTLVLELDFATGLHYSILNLLAIIVISMIALTIFIGKQLSNRKGNNHD